MGGVARRIDMPLHSQHSDFRCFVRIMLNGFTTLLRGPTHGFHWA